MKQNEFMEKVCHMVRGKLGETYEVDVRKMQKNNGVTLNGLCMSAKDHNASVVVYLESFWDAYGSGTPIEEIVGDVMRIYQENRPRDDASAGFFDRFDKVSEKICYRLVRQEGNEKMLQVIPHVPFLDLAICFFYLCSNGKSGNGTITVDNRSMERWHVSVDDLMKLAKRNTARLFPWKSDLIENILQEMVKGDEEVLVARNPLMVLSNEQRIWGASCILYPGVLNQLARKEGCSFYILPSSIHEVLLLPGHVGEPEYLKEMIVTVNRTEVSPEEVLSDSLYFYDLQDDEIKIIS